MQGQNARKNLGLRIIGQKARVTMQDIVEELEWHLKRKP
jgi:hypothetical protein